MNANKFAAASLGAIVTFNPLLRIGSSFLRPTDVAAVLLCLPAAILLVGPRVSGAQRGWFLGIFAATLVWLVLDVARGVDPRLPLRWLFCLVIATYLGASTLPVSRLVFGMLVGCALTAGFLWVEATSNLTQIGPIYLIDPESVQLYAQGSERASGIYGHPNATAGVVSLATPLAMVLFKRRPWIGIALGVGLTLVASALTLTRSILVVSAGTVLLALALRFPNRLPWLGLAATLAAIVVGPPGGWGRWLNGATTIGNLEGRIESMVQASKVIALHPLGAGTNYGGSVGGFAVHNAFLQASLYLGWLAAPVLVYILVKSFYTVRLWTTRSLMSTQLFGLFLFENHLNNITFIILIFYLALRTPTVFRAPDARTAGLGVAP